MLNRVMLIGRLGRDPEMRYTGSGTPVTTFSLATDEYWKDQSGERQQKTEWHNIVVWNKLGETCNNYLKKGKLVFIEGRIQTREYDDKDGNKRRITEIVASDVRFLDKREGGDDRPGAGGDYHRPSAPAPAQAAPAKPMEAGIASDDIPF